jgi:hypothetical protein
MVDIQVYRLLSGTVPGAAADNAVAEGAWCCSPEVTSAMEADNAIPSDKSCKEDRT